MTAIATAVRADIHSARTQPEVVAAWRRLSVTAVRSVAAPVAMAVIAAAGWELLKWLSGTNDLKMPHTWTIVAHLGSETSQGDLYWQYLLSNAWSTARASIVGLALGVLLGAVTGVIVARSRLIGKGLSPLIVAAQAVPIVAVAPAVVLWLGTGWATKAVIATYLTFFPITIAVTRGINSVPRESRELFRTIAASRTRVLFGLELPSALPLIFVGLETAAAFSVVGAIVAELPFGSRSGLGVVILTSWQFYTIEPAALYGVALASCALGGAFVAAIRLLARISLGDRRPGEVM